jgi:transcriptional regulator with XRE-family HTH domain
MAFSGDKLRGVRLRLGRTQRDVQSVSQATLSAIESGRQQPHPSTLRRLAEEYGVEVGDFFNEPSATQKASLPDDFDVLAITQEVIEENPELYQGGAEFRNLVYERFREELASRFEDFHDPDNRDAIVADLEAVSEELKARAARFDRRLNSPMWKDGEQVSAWFQLVDERKAVQLALEAVKRVLQEA